MSGRGRGGRGRGRSSATASVSQQFLLRSAQEAGFDVRNLRALNSSSGSIFSDLEWHSSGERRLIDGETNNDLPIPGENNMKQEQEIEPQQEQQQPPQQRTPQQISLISKTRELHHKFQSSAFYICSTKEVPDVIRYNDHLSRPSNIDSGAILSHCLGGRKRTRCGVFVPEEICGGQRRMVGKSSTGQTKQIKELNLEELVNKLRNDGDDLNNEEEEKADGDDVFYEEDGEESTCADYEKNYYESEGDESAGSDGEPVF